jgi:membrane-associated phospholipid phosphatase
VSDSDRARPGRLLAALATAAFVVLATVVWLGLLDAWDVAIRYAARPGEVWGPAQVNADYIVEGLRPSMLVPPVSMIAQMACWRRRSLRPALLTGAATLLTVTGTLGTKLLLARPDPGNTSSGHGGSFPSGHTVSLTVSAGLVILLISPRAPWWAWILPAALGTAMASSMVLQGAHWASDVLGGLLLATALLAVLRSAGAAEWAAGHRRCITAGTARSPSR